MEWKELNVIGCNEKYKQVISEIDSLKIKHDPATNKIVEYRYKISSKNSDYIQLRAQLEESYKKIYNQLIDKNITIKKKYRLDISLGFVLYEFLKRYNFNEYLANIDDLWRFISLEIIPDIVYDRFEDLEENTMAYRFYLMPRRIWLKYLWWYIHLTYQEKNEQGDARFNTIKCIDKFNTDYIVQLTERRGEGFNVNLTRTFSKIMAKSLEKNSKRKDFFRFISRHFMKLYTAKKMIYITLSVEHEKQLIKEIFDECVIMYEEEYG